MKKFLKFAIICFASSALLLVSCGKEEKDETPPVLSVPFIDVSRTVKFISFGESLGEYENCNYEIHVDGEDTDVFSASAGVITKIHNNAVGKPGDPGQADFEISVQPSKNSIYTVIYDHVKNLPPNIVVGASVAPGDRLGTVGHWSAGVGRTEFQINKTISFKDHQDVSLCPHQFGTPAFNAAMEVACNNGHLFSTAVCMRETVIP